MGEGEDRVLSDLMEVFSEGKENYGLWNTVVVNILQFFCKCWIFIKSSRFMPDAAVRTGEQMLLLC